MRKCYLKAYASGGEAKRELDAYFRFYNNQRPHQALGYRTPAEVYQHRPEAPDEKNPGRRWLEDPVVILDPGAAELSLNSAPFCPTNGVHLKFFHRLHWGS